MLCRTTKKKKKSTSREGFVSPHVLSLPAMHEGICIFPKLLLSYDIRVNTSNDV